ncbi:MAG: entericidin EcnA/B family protein [Albidovulum sp.]
MRAITLLTLLLSLAACNTVAGVGDDVAGGARTVQSWF